MCFCSLMRMNPTMFTERETSMREKPIAEVYPQTNKSFHGSHNPRRMEIVMCKAELVLCIDLFTYCFSCWNSGEKVFPQEKIFSSCLILFMVEQSYSRCSTHTHTHARAHTHTHWMKVRVSSFSISSLGCIAMKKHLTVSWQDGGFYWKVRNKITVGQKRIKVFVGK